MAWFRFSRPQSSPDAGPILGVPTLRHEGGKAMVMATLGREINLRSSDDLRRVVVEAIQTHRPDRVILDASAVEYLDSSALASLVEVYKAARVVGGKLFLTNLNERVAGIFRIARLDKIIHIVPGEAEALAE